MSDTLPIGLTYLSPVGNYGRQNTQALGGVSHLWQDFFARAMAEQSAEEQDSFSQALTRQYDKDSGEPLGGAQALALIEIQRALPVQDTEVRPPEPLFLPKAELEANLLEPAPEPFSASELIEQQRQLDLNGSWLRPLVMNQGHPSPEPGPAPSPRPLHLPIAELEKYLLEPAPEPFDDVTLAKQQTDLEFDTHWARPVVLNNVRVHA
ncbi:energy transducer TonB [Pseudomonas putida]|uniref:energy transducer TonB n=1 Tax=Pseudomonas putida TaxID=303 RepID=UPI000818FB8E|nr:energy transducer TonB [Pseudomonas putida]OCT24025.1 energy transducer TonB [Pseudomonas putida]OCT27104.1 energy transducer TonB [Pseudomonas putida]OCT28388.1 energy transducer TonB [Pseudomonas putida]OCT38378.1 energy transducer TonB [Pseudomonas putida]